MTRDEVAEVAALARLSLTDEELDRLTADLTRILAGAERLQWVEDASFGRLELLQGALSDLREDAVRPSLRREDALSCAPQRDGPMVRVPKMIGEGS